MTTDLLDLDAAPDPWEAGAEDEEDLYRCGCADCRALRERRAAPKDRETRDG